MLLAPTIIRSNEDNVHLTREMIEGGMICIDNPKVRTVIIDNNEAPTGSQQQKIKRRFSIQNTTRRPVELSPGKNVSFFEDTATTLAPYGVAEYIIDEVSNVLYSVISKYNLRTNKDHKKLRDLVVPGQEADSQLQRNSIEAQMESTSKLTHAIEANSALVFDYLKQIGVAVLTSEPSTAGGPGDQVRWSIKYDTGHILVATDGGTIGTGLNLSRNGTYLLALHCDVLTDSETTPFETTFTLQTQLAKPPNNPAAKPRSIPLGYTRCISRNSPIMGTKDAPTGNQVMYITYDTNDETRHNVLEVTAVMGKTKDAKMNAHLTILRLK